MELDWFVHGNDWFAYDVRNGCVAYGCNAVWKYVCIFNGYMKDDTFGFTFHVILLHFGYVRQLVYRLMGKHL